MFGICRFVINQKNGRSAHFEGNQYAKHKENGNKIHWRCTQYFINRCPGRITTVEENVVAKSEHSHAGDSRKTEKRVAFADMKEKAKTSNSPPRRVIRSITASMSKVSAISMPKYESMARNVRRWRKDGNMRPTMPDTLLDLVITGEYAQTIGGENFVLFDNKDPVNRIIIFTTQDNLSFMAMCDDWYMDGTFGVAPPLFQQLYTIHGRRMNRHFPLAYVLACKKDKKTYETIFLQLKLTEPKLDPNIVMVDFEQAAIAAASKIFPNADVTGCFFHFCQCIYRHIQGAGLQTIYQDDAIFASNIRCLAALAFVPVEDVVRRYNELKQFEFFKEKLAGTSAVDVGVQQLLLYMENTWIGSKPRRAYRAGLFALDLWNVYELTLDLFPRTNNAVEGWHNAIEPLFGVHPNIFKFIDGIKLEQNATEVLIGQMFGGMDVSAVTKNRNAVIQNRIVNVVKTYVDVKDQYSLKNYLVGVSQSIHLPN